jgi:glucose/arabinose dehydrogenase
MDLPGGGNHWARNLLLSADGGKLYVTVGSSSNIAENGIDQEKGAPRSTSTISPSTAAANSPAACAIPTARLESAQRRTVDRGQRARHARSDRARLPHQRAAGRAYGWPWAYWKKNIDWRVKEPMPEYMLEYTRKPEYALGSHVAPLGLAFARGGNVMANASRRARSSRATVRGTAARCRL